MKLSCLGQGPAPEACCSTSPGAGGQGVKGLSRIFPTGTESCSSSGGLPGAIFPVVQAFL